MDLPVVSVIIPCLNAATSLGPCLESLRRQTYPLDRIEIIVIDNGSSDSSPRVAKAFGIRLLYEMQSSSYAARNTGVAASNGRLLAFTDADCQPSNDWIANAVYSMMHDSSHGFLGGKVVLTVDETLPRTAAELFEFTFGSPFPQEHFIKSQNFGVTANLFVWRSAFDEVGPFDSRLRSAGDKEWGLRARSKGIIGRYDESVVVYHPALRSLRQLWVKAARLAGGIYDMKRLGLDGRSTPLWPLTASMRDLCFFALWIQRVHGPGRNLSRVQKVFLMLPMSTFPFAWRHPLLKTYSRKRRLKILIALFAHHLSSAIERSRLMLGKRSSRV